MKKNTTYFIRVTAAFLLSLTLLLPASLCIATPVQLRISKDGQSYRPTPNFVPIFPHQTQTKDIILSEGFEGSFPPPGWTRIITNDGVCDDFPQYSAHWDQFTEIVHSGAKAAYVFYDYQHQDEWLITPQISLLGVPDGKLTFWSYGYEGSTYGDHYYVKVSTDGGSTWTTLFDLSAFPPNQGWNYYEYPYTINLSAYMDQTITLAWRALDPPTNDGLWYSWCLDDIQVTGTTGADTTPPVTTCTLSGTMQGGIYITDVTATLTATDDNSGVNYTKYKLDYDNWATYTTPLAVSGAGLHILRFYSVDKAGNKETDKTVHFTIQDPFIITIKGGLGVQVTITNNATIPLTNITWSITLDGKLIFAGKTKADTIASLDVGKSKTVKDPVFGFGKTNIIVTVGSTEAVTSGTVFLFFVIGVK
jgi:hypothetical protein